MPQRCALGCPFDARVPHHRFPHPERNPERFKAWVDIVGGKLESPADYVFYRKKVICDIHFTDQVKNRNNRLNFLAVPSLHLCGKLNVSSIELSTLGPESNLPSTSKTVVSGNSEIFSSSMEVCPEFKPVANQPSTSKQVVRGISEIFSSTEVYPESEPVANEPSTSKQRVRDERACIALDHNYSSTQKKSAKRAKRFTDQELVPSLLVNRLQTSRRRIKHLLSEISRSRKRNESLKARLATADKMTTNILLKKITNNMTIAAKIFTKMQFTQTKKKPSGRRFTVEEKVLSLSMYKRSPKCYSLLAKYFTLPSAKSLKRLLSKIQLEPGLNKCIFLKIKDAVKKLSTEDRLCSLIFDEMSLSPQIHYDSTKDKLKGFTFDDKKIADHVLVFMVKGLKSKYKQPVAYYFTNSIKKAQLKVIIKNVIRYVQSTGLNILITVCDQSTINVSSINEIVEDTRKLFIREGKVWKHDILQVGNSKMIPLFDVPHLLKGIRNNMLTKDLKYFDFEEKVEKTIKWEYYQKIYEADKAYGELKMLNKLTDEHIYVEKMKKMKVKAAAQVFSHSVAVAAEHLTGRGDLPKECRNVIKFTKLIDNLFDSLNVNTFNVVPNGKLYKGCVRRNSPHHELWKTSLKILNTVTFIKKVKDKNNKIRFTETKAIPSIKNLIRTIKGIQQLWIILSQKYSFDAMFTRNFNQDPLENFFGNIRSYGARNTAPNTVAFEGAFKSLLLNNYNSPHSLHANCEIDGNNCLQTLDFFVTSYVPDDDENGTLYVPDDDKTPPFHHTKSEEIVVPFINLNSQQLDAGQGNYVCGWVLVKCLKIISKSCKICKKDLHGDCYAKSNEYIKVKEYRKGGQSLVYPTKVMEKCFIQIQNIVVEILKKDVPKNCLKQKIKMFTDIFVDFPFTCETHKSELIKYYENTVINVLIYSWCRSVNRILSGKITYHGDDEVKVVAQMYRNKHKHK